MYLSCAILVQNSYSIFFRFKGNISGKVVPNSDNSCIIFQSEYASVIPKLVVD